MESRINRRQMLKAVAATAVAAALPGVARAQTVPGKKYILSLAHNHTTGITAHDVFAVKFKELAAAKSGGAVEIQIFPNGMLGQEREAVQQVQQGIADMTASGSAIWGAVAPKVQILDLPFLFRDYAHIHKAMDGEPGQLLTKYMEEKTGVRALVYYDSFGFRNVVTRERQVKSIDDMKGLKIRTIQSPIYVKTIELMGASPTPMSFGEVYTSLQTGVIDGYEHDANTTLTQKFFEVTKYMALTQHISGVLVLAANAKSIDALPPDLKKAVLDAAKEAAAFQRARARRGQRVYGGTQEEGDGHQRDRPQALHGQGGTVLDIVQQGRPGRGPHQEDPRPVSVWPTPGKTRRRPLGSVTAFFKRGGPSTPASSLPIGVSNVPACIHD